MNELMNLNTTSPFPIDGRELHTQLGVATAYKDWFPRMCEYGFEAGKDFEVSLKTEQNPMGGRPALNHHLKLSMAKELCMLQRTEKGREVRRYLIAVEEAWNSPDAIMERALSIAHERVKALQSNVHHLKAANSELEVQARIMEPKADYFDELVKRGAALGLRETAKLLRVRERAFIAFLLSHGYLYRDRKGKLHPAAEYMDDLFVIKECYNEKTDWTGTQTLTTPKGRQLFHSMML